MDHSFPQPGRVVSLILGGGAGTRLFPLTKERAKPAVPLAGKYRLVDIPISLCINSGYRRIFLLTQYLSSSLHRHVQQSYHFDDYHPRGFIEILAATQSATNMDGWYQGTADAVRQNLNHYANHQHDLVLILSGDQLYRMDFRFLLTHHVGNNADVTVATTPVNRRDAKGFGIMKVSPEQQITKFVEKPKEDKALDSLKLSSTARKKLKNDIDGDAYLASMGIYVFSRKALEEALANEEWTDFGKDIIPAMIKTHKVMSYTHEGYWEDIGTIRAFYEANLDLTEVVPKFNFYDSASPIYSRGRFLPASKVNESKIERAVIADGCIISGAEINHSLIGIRSRIGKGVVIKDTVYMGADTFETIESLNDCCADHPPIGVGEGSKIVGALVDKDARIGRNVTISNEGKTENVDGGNFFVRDGIVIIPKGAVIPDNTVI